MSEPHFHDGILNWPSELPESAASTDPWYASPANLCLDFHGDPASAELVVFSDGNHHMALQEVLALFQRENDARIFYMTTPPSVVRIMIEQGGVYLGNLRVSAVPHILIGPDNFIQQMQSILSLQDIKPFMQSRGCALIVPAANPKEITGIHDLLREDIRIACSNPETETASYQVYRDTVLNYLQPELPGHQVHDFYTLQDTRMVFSGRIHHREVPALIANGKADVALVYYHLALRYARIFSDQVQMISLDNQGAGGRDVITRYHLALAASPGRFGQQCFDFLGGTEVLDIYNRHGLLAPGS